MKHFKEVFGISIGTKMACISCVLLKEQCCSGVTKKPLMWLDKLTLYFFLLATWTRWPWPLCKHMHCFPSYDTFHIGIFCQGYFSFMLFMDNSILICILNPLKNTSSFTERPSPQTYQCKASLRYGLAVPVQSDILLLSRIPPGNLSRRD